MRPAGEEPGNEEVLQKKQMEQNGLGAEWTGKEFNCKWVSVVMFPNHAKDGPGMRLACTLLKG